MSKYAGAELSGSEQLVECPFCSPDGTQGFPDGKICSYCGGVHDITKEEYELIWKRVGGKDEMF